MELVTHCTLNAKSLGSNPRRATNSILTTIQGCFFIEENNMKKKKERLNLCMIYHCKECPRSRKCEEEDKNYERRKIEQQSNHILPRIC